MSDACGQEWPRDPALEVACPTCKAPVGSRCRRPSGHPAGQLHADRDLAAMEAGILEKCPGKPANRVATAPAESSLFA